MKSSASRCKQELSLQKRAATRLLDQLDAGQRAGSRRTRIDERSLSSHLPDLLPVLPAESDLLRIYFADLIADVLKANS